MRPELIGLAWAMSATLGVIALFHALWGLGLPWPWGDRRSLARGAIGREAVPGPLSCFAVAAAVGAMALVPLAQTAIVIPPVPWPWVQAVALGCAAIFGVRGVAGYTPAFARRFPGEPFKTLNRLVYSPLCLALGAGFVALRWCYPT